MSIRELDDHEGVYVPDFNGAIQDYIVTDRTQYSTPEAHTLDKSAKERLLSGSDTCISEANRILAALETIDRDAHSHVGVKADAFSDFTFRLLHNEECRSVNSPIESFIVLSYTWRSPVWTPHYSLASNEHDGKGPLTPAMWTALLAQLREQECFWIDQLCITQSSESEKKAAIGSMDLVYRAARKVVVVLEDIALSLVDKAALYVYTKGGAMQQLSEDDRDRIASTFTKIVSARWFERAWCLHEFLVSKCHVFLVPVSQNHGPASTQSSILILRIDGNLLGRMFDIFLEQDRKRQNAGQESLLLNGPFNGTKIDQIRRLGVRLRALALQEALGTGEKPFEDGSFMNMFYEVSSHAAMYNTDKISIVLNSMRSGLYIKKPIPLSEEDCVWLITMVALAAGDATALATTGSRSIDGGSQLETKKHWVRAPSALDQAKRIGALRIPRTHINARSITSGLELDVLRLGTSQELMAAPSQYHLSIARWLIDHRALCPMLLDEQEMRLDMEADERTYAGLRIVYIQALACALACGRDWILAYHARSYVILPGGVDLHWNPEAKATFGAAVDWGLAIDIAHDIDPNLEESWQDFGTIMWASDVQHEGYGGNDSVASYAGEPWTSSLSADEEVWCSLLLDFVETLVTFGLAIPTPDLDTAKDFTWKVKMVSDFQGSNALVYAPEGQYHLCVPMALEDDAYNWMSRLWFLSGEERSGHYRLLGKSRIAGIRSSFPRPSQRVTIVG
ncbi:MAG: hypothetical protein Q9215_004536 [Flavoplaca cf. flavocitrina]